MNDLDAALLQLKQTVLTLSAKKQQILVQWIKVWSNYIIREQSFLPDKLKYYKRGDIVYVDFGFNVGNEYGGIHYAVVLEANNSKRNGNIVVIPLTSLDTGKCIEDIARVDVYLGADVIPWTNAATIAKPNQIRAISKMRIVKPVTAKDKIAKLTADQLDLIDNKLKELIFQK